MASKCARLRTDLVIQQESPGSGSYIVVKDPITRGFYRFPAVQAAVLRRLDGVLDFGEVASAASLECGAAVTPEQVEAFAANLLKLLLLDHPHCWKQLDGRGPARAGFPGNLLSIKIRAFNPDPFLTRWEPRLRFFFSPAFAFIAAVSFVAALIICAANSDALLVSAGALFTLHSLPMVLAVAFSVMTLHELAHGFTLKHFGGTVHEMGFLILYFIPAFYCNVDDAWLLPKRKRILVTLAGGYIQLTIWAWATIGWRLLAQETAASAVMSVVIAFCGIQALFNFNPLIRLDGYYLLSDGLELPNLRTRAFRHIRRRAREMLAGMRVQESPASAVARENAIYGWYGVAALTFTAGLLWIVFQRLGGWLVREYQAWGVLTVGVLMAMMVAGAVKPGEGLPGKNAGGTSSPKRRRWVVPTLLLALFGASLFPWELTVTGDFTIVPNQKAMITPEVDGTLKSIRAEEGSRVRSGDVLAELENLDLRNEYEETAGELASQRAALDLLIAGTRPEEIDKSRRQVDTRRAELATSQRVEEERKLLLETVAKFEAEVKNAGSNYQRTLRLYNEGLLARADLERDQTAYSVRQKELEEARGQLKVLEERLERTLEVKRKEVAQAESEVRILLAGSRKESIRAVQALVNKLVEKQAILGRQLEKLQIRCAMDGIVATPYLRNRLGEYISKGDYFCEIVSSGTVITDMPVPEKEIADVQIGFPIVIKVRGFPHRSFTARVKSISPVAVDGGAEKKVVVLGELENSDSALKAGMTGVGKIQCGKRMILNLLTRRAIRWLRTEFWEYLP